MDALIGPFTVEVKVHFSAQEGKAIGSATVGLSAGRVPTLADIHRAIGQTLRALPDECELLGGDDFFNRVLVKEKTGRVGNFATPSGFDFDVAALTEQALEACPEPEDEPESDDDMDDDDWGEDE